MRLGRIVPVLLVAAACGEPPPTPVFDTTIGATAIPVKPGALAGRFVLYLEVATLVDAPLVGLKPGGGDSWFLVTRTWDPATQTYQETHRLCGGHIWLVAGTQASIPDSTRRKVPPRAVQSVTVTDAGAYTLTGHLEMWGLKGVPDPWNAPLSTTAAGYLTGPDKAYVTDMDGDGKPGVTAHVVGLATGDVYFVQRRRINLKGITRGPDRVFGLNFTDALKVTIGATSALLASPTPVRADPDPQRSWFDEARLKDTATCDDVAAKVAAGFGRYRPF